MKGRQLLNTIGTAIGALPAAPAVREAVRVVPIPESTKYVDSLIDDAADAYLEGVKPGAKLSYGVSENTPDADTALGRLQQVLDSPNTFASSSAPGKESKIYINPNADRALYAHEVGHHISQQTDVGNLAASLRYNPALKNALIGALAVAPGAAAIAEEGNDDLDSSLALAAATALPTMIDEGLATQHGLGVLNKAGMRADLGQRGKLAGGLLSYLAPALIAGTAGNVVGNMLD